MGRRVQSGLRLAERAATGRQPPAGRTGQRVSKWQHQSLEWLAGARRFPHNPPSEIGVWPEMVPEMVPGMALEMALEMVPRMALEMAVGAEMAATGLPVVQQAGPRPGRALAARAALAVRAARAACWTPASLLAALAGPVVAAAWAGAMARASAGGIRAGWRMRARGRRRQDRPAAIWLVGVWLVRVCRPQGVAAGGVRPVVRLAVRLAVRARVMAGGAAEGWKSGWFSPGFARFSLPVGARMGPMRSMRMATARRCGYCAVQAIVQCGARGRAAG